MLQKILVADDEPLLLQFLRDALARLQKRTFLAKDGEEAIALLQKETFDLVITDIKMPKKSGLDVLQAVQQLPSPCPVILATAFGTIESAVEAMQKGAFHYLLKPFSFETLRSVLAKVEEQESLLVENRFLREEQRSTNTPWLTSKSPSMKPLLANLEKIAKSQASCFITGESGTGKEVLASAIHQLSLRSSKPFIKVNCAAIPDTLLESEFFGHEKGSFTGALTQKRGRFELAHQGTLLLDEVTEIPLSLQPKLLRALQEQEFERVGGSESLKVNIRFLATSNRSMQEAIDTKVFREDLFYRLNVIPLHIPPLRERKEDILSLASHFLDRFCTENHKPKKTFSPSAKKRLLEYAWPGNVRELANIIERVVVLDFASTIEEEHVYLSPLPRGHSPSSSLYEVEKACILERLRMHQKNRSKTAESLGISAQTLGKKLEEYGLEEELC